MPLALTLDPPANLSDYTALRAYTGPEKKAQITASGIAGYFTLDDSDTTSADNGGTIIVASSGKRWKRMFDGRYNVKWWGATGDGSTDDAAALQAACNAVCTPTSSNYGGGVLYFPRGTYKWLTPITLPNAPFHIVGDGQDSVLNPQGCSGFLYPGQSTTTSYVSDVYMLGNSTAGTEAFNANPSTATWVTAKVHWHRVRISGFPRMFNIPTADLWVWEDCVFNCDTGGSVFYVHPTANGQQSNSNRLSRCQITGNNCQVLDFADGGFTSVGTYNWDVDCCDVQISGTTVPFTIRHGNWFFRNLESENCTAACVIDLVANDTVQPNFCVIEGGSWACAPTVSHIRADRTGAVQYMYGLQITAVNVGTSNLLYHGSGSRAALLTNCSGNIVENNTSYPAIFVGGSIKINSSAALLGGISSIKQLQKAKSISYNGTMAVDLSTGNIFDVNVTGSSAITLQNPTMMIADQIVWFLIKNTSGGAMGALTFDTAYKLAAWTNPANGFSRSIAFRCDGTNMIEVARTPADVPN